MIQVFSFNTLGQTRLPDGTDPPPLRDEGVVGDEDHGALLDLCAVLCACGFALYYRYYFQFFRGDDGALVVAR